MMLKCSRLVTLGALLGTVTACAKWDESFMLHEQTLNAQDDIDMFAVDIDDVRAMEPQGSDFTKGLRAGYLDLTGRSWGLLDPTDDNHFIRKAVASAKGLNVQPDMVTLRKLSEEQQAELGAAYARLIATLDAGARSKAAIAAAEAQVSYDCWLQAEEAGNHVRIDNCKQRFEAAMSEVEDALAGDIGNVYIVFFAWDSAIISPVANEILQSAASAFANGEAAKVILAGHTDTTGTEAYNEGLSERRARTVAGELITLGVDADQIEVTWFGETELRVPTEDEVREPQNRRVEITLQ